MSSIPQLAFMAVVRKGRTSRQLSTMVPHESLKPIQALTKSAKIGSAVAGAGGLLWGMYHLSNMTCHQDHKDDYMKHIVHHN
mmetsp:Transcript_17850/g.34566  ORF Transcript_17850/g.34566 Transcript_17850/m.34566 type:complete len:82 (+) Transcript_17850:57-302(+)|eukprot:CAMPEP_0167772500 /NCGR_PEP_ID=MMETSP0111_2-20121227/883_1 /TAXON_ID=91324 /ORGANISM="Lotharella globosa, Strain CCCM811" /LENGTH=81 /DNA_ID=CAMNT_0007662001 /DNA_START=34 /DNA_END=279 /DNA_ORIENTATION=-